MIQSLRHVRTLLTSWDQQTVVQRRLEEGGLIASLLMGMGLLLCLDAWCFHMMLCLRNLSVKTVTYVEPHYISLYSNLMGRDVWANLVQSLVIM